MNTISIAFIRRQQLRVNKLTEQFAVCMETYRDARKATDRAIITESEAFLEAGQKLREVKAELPHGDWLKWLASNFQRSERTAENWMRVARWVEKHLPELCRPNSQHAANLPSVATLMRLAGVDRRPRASEPLPFTIALALRWVAPWEKFDVALLCALPIEDQQRLYSPLNAVQTKIGEVLKTLPRPTPQASS